MLILVTSAKNRPDKIIARPKMAKTYSVHIILRWTL
jgi:hypothetical protein